MNLDYLWGFFIGSAVGYFFGYNAALKWATNEIKQVREQIQKALKGGL